MNWTKEQEDQIKSVEAEIKSKQEYERLNKDRKEKTAQETGIPFDMVDMDVVKIGILLGLIKRKGATGGGLLDLLFPDEGEVDRSNIPSHFRNVSEIEMVDECKREGFIQNNVDIQSRFYSDALMTTIKNSLVAINKHIVLNVDLNTSQVFEQFVDALQENIKVLLDTLDEEEDPQSLMEVIYNIRLHLLGPMTLCKYKNFLLEHVSHLNNRFWTLEKRLCLYRGCLKTPCNSLSVVELNFLKTELLFKSYNLNPQLMPFSVGPIIARCCTPSLLMVPVHLVLEYMLLNPYMTNSIGYLNVSNSNVPHSKVRPKSGEPWSIYVLKGIEGRARLWVLDSKAAVFIATVRRQLLSYLRRLFRAFYEQSFDHNRFIATFLDQSFHKDVFVTLLQNMLFVADPDALRTLIHRLICTKSYIIATKFDFFNQLTFSEAPNDNVDARTFFESLFDGDSDSKRVSEFVSGLLTHPGFNRFDTNSV